MHIDFSSGRGEYTPMDIIEHIKSRGMTVAAVARMAGVSRPTVYALSDPDRKPALHTVIAVARVIGVKPADMFPEISG